MTARRSECAIVGTSSVWTKPNLEILNAAKTLAHTVFTLVCNGIAVTVSQLLKDTGVFILRFISFGDCGSQSSCGHAGYAQLFLIIVPSTKSAFRPSLWKHGVLEIEGLQLGLAPKFLQATEIESWVFL